MIIDMGDLPLFEEWKAAREAEGVAVNALHSALKNGIQDMQMVEALTKQMEAAHNNAMDIYDQLIERSLDNE